jgi:exodeoxyribonuclease V alpha subunit
MLTENSYDKEMFDGDIGQIVSIDPHERELAIRFEKRDVCFAVHLALGR